MEHQSEPCASIPKSHVSLDLVWCHHHQAWTLTGLVYDEDADITLDEGRSTVVRFGPFDDSSDVMRAASRFLADALRLPRYAGT